MGHKASNQTNKKLLHFIESSVAMELRNSILMVQKVKQIFKMAVSIVLLELLYPYFASNFEEFRRKLHGLTLNAPITTKVVCFSRLLKCLRSLYGKQCGPTSVCSGSTLFDCILDSSVMLGNYLQQTTSADNIFRYIFFLAL